MGVKRRQLSHGRRDALERLMPIVYDELRRIAHSPPPERCS
jgi:hypothetical protein